MLIAISPIPNAGILTSHVSSVGRKSPVTSTWDTILDTPQQRLINRYTSLIYDTPVSVVELTVANVNKQLLRTSHIKCSDKLVQNNNYVWAIVPFKSRSRTDITSGSPISTGYVLTGNNTETNR